MQRSKFNVLFLCTGNTSRSIIDAPRRAGDPARLVAESRLIRRELDWTPRFADIDTIVRDAWNFERSRPR